MTTTDPDAVLLARDGRRTRRRAAGRFSSLDWRRVVAWSFVASALLLVDPVGSPLRPWGFPAGAALAACGEALRIWGCGHLRKNRDVVSSGPYAYVRNPLYLGTLLILVGVCVAGGGRLVVGLLLPLGLAAFFGYYAPKKERIESARLRRRFGARFDEYRRAVPGYLPRLTPWSRASRERWEASLVAENSEIPTLLIVAAGLAFVAARLALPV